MSLFENVKGHTSARGGALEMRNVPGGEGCAVVKVAEYIISLIFPPKCIFCNTILDVESELHICPGCYKKIEFLGEVRPGPESTSKDQCCDAVISA